MSLGAPEHGDSSVRFLPHSSDALDSVALLDVANRDSSGGDEEFPGGEPLVERARRSSPRASPSHPLSDARSEMTKRLYEVWPGRQTPICCGACLLGPDLGTWIVAWLLILGNGALFVGWVARPLHWAAAAGGIALVLLVSYMLSRATFTEAGIIMRKPGPPPADPQASAPRVVVKGVNVELKFCTACNIYRPPRAKHCRDCDVCVEEFDHHCPWVCNCVGKRNYRFFVGFLISASVFVTYVFGVSLAVMIMEALDSNFGEAMSRKPAAMIEVVQSVIFGWCLWSLTCYHFFLIESDMTTNEHLKNFTTSPATGAESDVKPSFCAKLAHVLCSPLPPSAVDLRAPVDRSVALENVTVDKPH
jgi:palmitoyltransferase ZDHHC9/14/18